LPRPLTRNLRSRRKTPRIVDFAIGWTSYIDFFNHDIDFLDYELHIALDTQERGKTVRAQIRDWQELTRLTGGAALVVERVRVGSSDIAIEGAFAPPRLAQLSAEDQVFVAAFVRSHGSIKEMERVFGVSYPTVKARLNRIAAALEFIDENPKPLRREVIARLERGEISPAEAIAELEATR
jgi:hypothetical protein